MLPNCVSGCFRFCPSCDFNIVFFKCEFVPSNQTEKIVKLQLNEHLENMNVFSDFQFGFRKGRSTEQLLSLAANSWYRARDSGLVTAIVFI